MPYSVWAWFAARRYWGRASEPFQYEQDLLAWVRAHSSSTCNKASAQFMGTGFYYLISQWILNSNIRFFGKLGINISFS